MKSYSLLIIFGALIVLSCKNENSETANMSGLADSILTEDNIEHSIEIEDSIIFHISNHAFEISASTQNDFNAVADPFKIKDTSEAKRILKVASAVSRSGDSLIFICSNKATYLINDPNDDDDHYANYTFIQDMPQINQWLIMATYYEAYGYVFIDKMSGDSTLLYGMPVVSPDNKYIITFNQDLQAGFTYNGFQLFEIKDSKPVLQGEKELYNWGPDNVKWKDATTLLVQQAKSDSEMNLTADYIQIKMK